MTCTRAEAYVCRDVLLKPLGLAVELASPSLSGFLRSSLVPKSRSPVLIGWELELACIELA